MAYRLVGQAEQRITRILTTSARTFGIEAADRYNRLMFAAFAALSDDPFPPGSQVLPEVAGVRLYALRLARDHVEITNRVRKPRHVVIYRVAPDGVVEILGVAHDRMLLPRAAQRMRREADR